MTTAETEVHVICEVTRRVASGGDFAALGDHAVSGAQALCDDLAIAWEHERVGDPGEFPTPSLRTMAVGIGLGLMGVGVLVLGAATLAHLAHALPLTRLPARPGVLLGAVMTALGAVLAHLGRQAERPKRGMSCPRPCA
jgi:hypothetical protein